MLKEMLLPENDENSHHLGSHMHPTQDCWVQSPFAAGLSSDLVDGCPFQLLAPTDLDKLPPLSLTLNSLQ